MKTTAEHDERMAKMTFASVYPHYVAKIEKKGRTVEELQHLNPRANLITGSICGYRIEEIENPVTRQIRYLDKLVDELAKGKAMEKILR